MEDVVLVVGSRSKPRPRRNQRPFNQSTSPPRPSTFPSTRSPITKNHSPSPYHPPRQPSPLGAGLESIVPPGKAGQAWKMLFSLSGVGTRTAFRHVGEIKDRSASPRHHPIPQLNPTLSPITENHPPSQMPRQPSSPPMVLFQGRFMPPGKAGLAWRWAFLWMGSRNQPTNLHLRPQRLNGRPKGAEDVKSFESEQASAGGSTAMPNRQCQSPRIFSAITNGSFDVMR